MLFMSVKLILVLWPTIFRQLFPRFFIWKLLFSSLFFGSFWIECKLFSLLKWGHSFSRGNTFQNMVGKNVPITLIFRHWFFCFFLLFPYLLFWFIKIEFYSALPTIPFSSELVIVISRPGLGELIQKLLSIFVWKPILINLEGIILFDIVLFKQCLILFFNGS